MPNTLMISPRDFTLSSTKGYILRIKANQPVAIPGAIFQEAVAAGMVPAPTKAPAPAPEPEPVVEVEQEEIDSAVRHDTIATVIKQLVIEAEETNFKADGTPKASAVVAALPDDFKRPTASEIADVYESLQDDISLLED